MRPIDTGAVPKRGETYTEWRLRMVRDYGRDPSRETFKAARQRMWPDEPDPIEQEPS